MSKYKIGPMRLLLNVHSILKFHGSSSPDEIQMSLEERGYYVSAEELHTVLHLDATDYFMIRKSTHTRNVWEAIR